MRPAGIAMAMVCGAMAASAAQAGDDAHSMFDEHRYRSLVAETKAARIGDVLTVIVQESASATSSADLHAQRSYSLSGHYDSPATGPAKTAAIGHESAS